MGPALWCCRGLEGFWPSLLYAAAGGSREKASWEIGAFVIEESKHSQAS